MLKQWWIQWHSSYGAASESSPVCVPYFPGLVWHYCVIFGCFPNKPDCAIIFIPEWEIRTQWGQTLQYFYFIEDIIYYLESEVNRRACCERNALAPNGLPVCRYVHVLFRGTWHICPGGRRAFIITIYYALSKKWANFWFWKVSKSLILSNIGDGVAENRKWDASIPLVEQVKTYIIAIRHGRWLSQCHRRW